LKVPERVASPDLVNECGSPPLEIRIGALNWKNEKVQIEPTMLLSRKNPISVPAPLVTNWTVPLSPGGGPECVPS
jgi:hypothetical protein